MLVLEPEVRLEAEIEQVGGNAPFRDTKSRKAINDLIPEEE